MPSTNGEEASAPHREPASMPSNETTSGYSALAQIHRARKGSQKPSRSLKTLAAAILLAAVTLAKPTPAKSQIPTPPAAAKPDLPLLPPPPNDPSVQPAFSVVLDPAHGGANTGARIATNAVESDINLALAQRLHSALAARGISVVVTRESDTDLSYSQRAGIANHSLAAACLILHSTASGSGVHLFTSSLAPTAAQANPSSFLPWQTAQSVWVTRSLRLASEINSGLGQAGIPVTLGRTALQPLDSLTCPAVAIEIAPLTASHGNKALALSDPKYQQRLVDALTAAMLEWSTDWKQQP